MFAKNFRTVKQKWIKGHTSLLFVSYILKFDNIPKQNTRYVWQTLIDGAKLKLYEDFLTVLCDVHSSHLFSVWEVGLGGISFYQITEFS